MHVELESGSSLDDRIAINRLTRSKQARVLALVSYIKSPQHHIQDIFAMYTREECFHFFAEPRVCGVSTFTKRRGYAVDILSFSLADPLD